MTMKNKNPGKMRDLFKKGLETHDMILINKALDGGLLLDSRNISHSMAILYEKPENKDKFSLAETDVFSRDLLKNLNKRGILQGMPVEFTISIATKPFLVQLLKNGGAVFNPEFTKAVCISISSRSVSWKHEDRKEHIDEISSLFKVFKQISGKDEKGIPFSFAPGLSPMPSPLYLLAMLKVHEKDNTHIKYGRLPETLHREIIEEAVSICFSLIKDPAKTLEKYCTDIEEYEEEMDLEGQDGGITQRLELDMVRGLLDRRCQEFDMSRHEDPEDSFDMDIM